MKLGLLQSAHARQDGSSADVYRQWVENAVEGERLGFWGFWTTEHHFGSDPDYQPFGLEDWPVTDYDIVPDSLLALTYIAARTTRLRLGSAVAVLHWDHPVRVAERAAMLDAFSGGRVELGVGRGQGFREVAVFDIPVDEAVNRAKYAEAVEVIRQLWTGDPVTFDGTYFKLDNIALRPRPVQASAPLWLAAGSEQSAAWAAEQHLQYANAVFPLTSLESFKRRIALFEEAAAESGYDTSDAAIPHVLFLYCGESDAEAEETATPFIQNYQNIIESHYEIHRKHEQNVDKSAGHKEFEDRTQDTITRAVLDNHIVGSAATCLERLQSYAREIDHLYPVFNIGYGQMPQDLTQASMARFADHVMPHLEVTTPTVAGSGVAIP
jgi:alkanesulfonate monooxygenase SsuD/methylene tetrahydromethanopterin reductase-like flavin-dependent oxidoreductase (luciferase family)